MENQFWIGSYYLLCWELSHLYTDKSQARSLSFVIDGAGILKSNNVKRKKGAVGKIGMIGIEHISTFSNEVPKKA